MDKKTYTFSYLKTKGATKDLLIKEFYNLLKNLTRNDFSITEIIKISPDFYNHEINSMLFLVPVIVRADRMYKFFVFEVRGTYYRPYISIRISSQKYYIRSNKNFKDFEKNIRKDLREYILENKDLIY